MEIEFVTMNTATDQAFISFGSRIYKRTIPVPLVPSAKEHLRRLQQTAGADVVILDYANRAVLVDDRPKLQLDDLDIGWRQGWPDILTEMVSTARGGGKR